MPTSDLPLDRRGLWRKVLSAAMIFASGAWIGWILYSDSASAGAMLTEMNLGWFALVLALGLIASLQSAPIFRLLLQLYASREVHFIQAARILFAGQFVRYLPGRFWGLVYQVQAARGQQISAWAVLRANVDFMALTIGAGLVAALAIVLWSAEKGVLAFLVAAAGVISALPLLRASHHLDRALDWLARRMHRRTPIASRSVCIYSWHDAAVVVSICTTSWLVYLLAWSLFDRALPAFEGVNMPLLFAAYQIAWLAGYLVLVVPGGLGVREAVFTLLSVGWLPPVEAAVLALYARLWLLVIDLALFLFFTLVRDQTP